MGTALLWNVEAIDYIVCGDMLKRISFRFRQNKMKNKIHKTEFIVNESAWLRKCNFIKKKQQKLVIRGVAALFNPLAKCTHILALCSLIWMPRIERTNNSSLYSFYPLLLFRMIFKSDTETYHCRFRLIVTNDLLLWFTGILVGQIQLHFNYSDWIKHFMKCNWCS